MAKHNKVVCGCPQPVQASGGIGYPGSLQRLASISFHVIISYHKIIIIIIIIIITCIVFSENVVLHDTKYVLFLQYS